MNSTSLSSSDVSIVTVPRRLPLTGLASGAAWTIAASVTSALAQWLLLMATAKLGSVEMVGQLAIALAIVSPIQALTDLALRPALATDAKRDFRFRDYWWLRGMMIVVFLAAVGSIALWRAGTAGPIIFVVGLQKAVESASDLFFGLFQREDRLRWMGQSVVLRSALSSLAFVGVMLVFGNLFAACLSGWIVRLGLFFANDYRRGAALAAVHDGSLEGGGGSQARRIGKLLVASLPLAVAVFLASFAVNIPRYVVEKRMGAAMLGIFAALIYSFQAGAMLIDAVGQAACSRLAHYHVVADDRGFQTLLLRLCGLAAGASAVAILAALIGGGQLLRLIYSKEFALQARTFLLLSVCTVPWYCSSMLGYGLIARRQMQTLFLCQSVSLAATLAASYWLIGSVGLSGACGVVFLTYLVQLALLSLALWGGHKGVTA